MQISLTGYQCLRCGHQWKPRGSAAPERCPKCDSRKWQVPPGEELPPQLAEVFQLYEVPQAQRTDIIRYAFQHPGVAQALKAAVPELVKVFGKARRRLDLAQFWDGGGDEQLFGLVQIKDEDEDQDEILLDRFHKAWSPKVPHQVRLYLNFDVITEDDHPI